ncbi:MAG: ABC transporter permease [Planctomycetes bacterium]|nr:ABC transporter permease [Planctomycetota bacterium]
MTPCALRKIAAYLRKEYLIERSYRFAFLFSVLGIFTGIATYFFIDRMYAHASAPGLEPFGTSYFAYALVGNAFFAYLGASLGGIAGRIGAEQRLGTLEAILATPTSPWVLMAAMAAWNVLYASLEVGLYFLVGAVGFGVDLSRADPFSTGLLLALVVLAFSSLGIVEASCVLVFKRGTFVAWAMNGVFALLGGVFFPVSVLPAWLRPVSELLPITHAIRGLQMAIHQGSSVADLTVEIGVLMFFCVLLVPVGILALRWGLRRARTDGTLSDS